MEITNGVTIDRPAPVVFAAWSELERLPEWYVDAIERRKMSEGPVGVGTTYHAVDKVPPGRRIEGTLEVTRFEPHSLISANLSDPYNANWEVTFEEAGGSTRMTMHLVATLSGIQVLVAPLVSRWARRVQQRGLEAFKADLETR